MQFQVNPDILVEDGGYELEVRAAPNAPAYQLSLAQSLVVRSIRDGEAIDELSPRVAELRSFGVIQPLDGRSGEHGQFPGTTNPASAPRATCELGVADYSVIHWTVDPETHRITVVTDFPGSDNAAPTMTIRYLVDSVPATLMGVQADNTWVVNHLTERDVELFRDNASSACANVTTATDLVPEATLPGNTTYLFTQFGPERPAV